MEYSTYWSILDTPSHTIKSNIVGLIIAITSAFIWIWAKKFKKDSGDGDRKLILWAGGIFTFLGLAMYVSMTFFCKDKSGEQTSAILNSASAYRVEGVVSDFKRTFRHTRFGNATNESFRVDSVLFSYGDELLGKFNSFTETNNEVIYDGQKVRITYAPNSPGAKGYSTILKLEIGQ